MALHVCSGAPRTSMLRNSASHGILATEQPAAVCFAVDYPQLNMKRKERRLSIGFGIRSCLDSGAAAAEVGRVTEVSKDTFWPIVKAAGDKTVVLDAYTQWCGPCKVIAPQFQKLSQKYNDVVFLKLDCNQENRPLAKELGIKVVPTFKILKDGMIVKEVCGAKLDDLIAAIDTVRST